MCTQADIDALKARLELIPKSVEIRTKELLQSSDPKTRRELNKELNEIGREMLKVLDKLDHCYSSQQ